jgi:hypothetical protein
MNYRTIFVFLAVLSAAAAALFLSVGLSAGDAQDSKNPSGGIATLYLRDTRLSSYSFTLGAYGRVYRGNDVYSGSADIDFSWWNDGCMTVAFKGFELGRIHDLGDLMIKDEGVELKPGEIDIRGREYSVYDSLCIRDKSVQYKFAPYTERWKILTDELGGIFLPGVHAEKAPIYAGHVYLIRTTDKDGKEKVFVKLRILEYVSGERVTFVWEKLR